MADLKSWRSHSKKGVFVWRGIYNYSGDWYHIVAKYKGVIIFCYVSLPVIFMLCNIKGSVNFDGVMMRSSSKSQNVCPPRTMLNLVKLAPI